MKKKWIGLLMVLSFIVSLMVVPNNVQAKDKGYLVLVQNENGWVAYENMACTSPKNNIMIRAYSVSKILGLSYKNSDKNFTIANGKKKLTFTKNSTKYKYYDGIKTVNKTATYKSYSSKAFGKAVNLVHYSIFNSLSVYTQYYAGSKATDYKVLGYKGIICFSTIGKITNIPNINKVVDTNGNKLENDTNNNGNNNGNSNGNSNVGYDGSVTIGGVQIPKLPGFSDAYDDSTGHWGNDVKGDTPLEDAIKEFSAQMKKDIIALNDDDNSGIDSSIKVSDNTIIAQIDGDSTQSVLRLSKSNDNGTPIYEIYVNVRLKFNSEWSLDGIDYTPIYRDVLKLYSYCITNNGNSLYQNIYNHAEIDSSIISKTSWKTIDNYQIKYRAENGALIYSIKAK